MPRRKKRRTLPGMQQYEEALKKYKPDFIIAADECAWGAVSYNLQIACAVYKPDFKHEKIKDSKRYTTDRAREKAFEIVQETAIHIDYEEATPEILYNLGAGIAIQKTYLTVLKRSIEKYPNSLVIVDGSHLIKNLNHPQVAIVAGDSLIPACSAASVAGKVKRDREITQLSDLYPEFMWYKNKGYPTPQHLQSIKQHGITKHHRMNVDLMQEYLLKYGKYEDKK